MSELRSAIYYAPLPDDPLAGLAASWLGRDATSGAAVTQPPLDGIFEMTAEPRRYGFHATLKPPMRLADGRDLEALVEATRSVAAAIAPFTLPALGVREIDGFLALQETEASVPLQALADVCVERLDAFRAPPSETELARRRKARLSAEQDAMLQRWGYPYVFGTWFFHMTLTRRLSVTERAVILPAAEQWFLPALGRRQVSDICIFIQPTPGADFTIFERLPLRG